MYKPSDEYLNYISSSIIRKPLSKIVVDGVEYRQLKSYPKIEHSDDSPFGVFPIKECTFEIYDLEGTLSLRGKEIEVYRGLTLPTGDEWIPMGIFDAEADGISSNASAKTVKFKGYDRARKFDIEYNGENQIFPCTVCDFVRKICKNHLVELESENFPLSDLTLSEQPEIADGTTERELISKIAELGGCIAQITRDGKLRISKSYKTDRTLSPSKYKDFSKNTPIHFSKVNIVSDAGTLSLTAKNNGEAINRQYEIENNPFTKGREEELITQVGENIISSTITPFEISQAIDDFIFDLGDEISVLAKDNTASTVTVLSISTQDRIKSTLKAEISSGETTVQGSVKQQLKVQEKKTELFEKAQESLNSIMSGALGLYKTENAGASGGKIVYFHNEPTLTLSSYIVTVNSSGFAYTTGSGCWNGGEPKWKYGVDKDGNAVLNTLALHGLTADWIKAGTILSKDETTRFDLDKGEITTEKSSTDTSTADSTTQKATFSSGYASFSKTKNGKTVSQAEIGKSGVFMKTAPPENFDYRFTPPENWDTMTELEQNIFKTTQYLSALFAHYKENAYGINVVTEDENGENHFAHLDGTALKFDGVDYLKPLDFSSEVDFESGEEAQNSFFVCTGKRVDIFYQGQVKAHSSGDLLFTLPAELAPKEQVFTSFVKNAVAYGTVGLQPDGRVAIGFISSTTATGRIYFQSTYYLN